MGLNFLGNTWANHFVFCCILRQHFVANPGSLESLVAAYAEDVQQLATTGISSTDGRLHIWCVHVGTKGDLPALTKLGSFRRSFGNVPRQPSSRTPCGGICHLCLGGKENTDGSPMFPFEDMSGKPKWLESLNAEVPWISCPNILQGNLIEEGRQAEFFKLDIWHNVHMGVAKSWLGSAFVSMAEMSTELPGQSLQARFDFMSRDYLEFCRRVKAQPYVDGINRDTLCFPQSSACPEGKWSKAACSTIMMKYLENLTSRFVAGRDAGELLLAVAAWL